MYRVCTFSYKILILILLVSILISGNLVITLAPSTSSRGYTPGSATPASWDEYDATGDTVVTASTFNTEQSLQRDMQLTMQRNQLVGTGATTSPTLAPLSYLSTQKDTILREDDNTPHPKQTDRLLYGGEQSDEHGNIITNPPVPLATTNQAVTKYILSSNQPNVSGSTTAVASARDEDRPAGDNCIQTTGSTQSAQNPIPNRRMGVCNDGIYRIKTRSVDTAGNREWWKEKGVERDTVGPGAGTLNAILSDYGSGQMVNLTVSGEANTNLKINTIIQGTSWSSNKNYTLDSSGIFNATNYLGMLRCGGAIYQFTITIKDRAGNSSINSQASVTTKACPILFSDPEFPSSTVDNDLILQNGGDEKIIRARENFISYLENNIESCAREDMDGLNIAAKGINANTLQKDLVVMLAMQSCYTDGFKANDSLRDTALASTKDVKDAYNRAYLRLIQYISYDYELAQKFWWLPGAYKLATDVGPLLTQITATIAAVTVDVGCSAITAGLMAFAGCPAAAAATYSFVKIMMNAKDGLPIDFGNESLEFATNYLALMTGSFIVRVTVGLVKYIFIKGLTSQVGRIMLKTADVCAAGEPLMPLGGLSEDFIPQSNTLPAGTTVNSNWRPDTNNIAARNPGLNVNSDPVVQKLQTQGINFNNKGYLDMTPYAEQSVTVNMTDNRNTNFQRANQAAGISDTYLQNNNLTWHEVEDGKTMQLVKKYVNNPANGGPVHRGGFANIKSYLNNLKPGCRP